MSTLARCGLALACCVSFASSASAQENQGATGWSGQWDSHWRNGRARLVLTQEGDRVTGVYFPRDGRITARVVGDGGRVLEGSFSEQGREGEFTFSLAHDGQSFMGRFDSGEWWNGGRLSDATNVVLRGANLESPRESLKSFLTAFNQIRHGGLDFVRMGLESVDFGPDGDELTSTERFIHASALFDVVNACVMHIWDLPDGPTAEREAERPSPPPAPATPPSDSDDDDDDDDDTEAEPQLDASEGPEDVDADAPPTPEATRPAPATTTDHRLRYPFDPIQLGTDVKVDLDFVRDAEGNWRIEAPPLDALLDLRRRLREARGVLDPSPNAHFELPHPRGTVRTFIEQVKLWDEGSAELVMTTMDLSEIDPEIRETEAPLLAEYLKQVLDRAGYLIWQELPNDPESEEPYVHFQHPLGRVVVAPTRDPENPEAPAKWRFTPETLRTIRALYDAFEDLPVAEGLIQEESRSPYFRLRSAFRRLSNSWVRRVGSLERWQALSVALMVILALTFVLFAGRIPRLARRFMSGDEESIRERTRTIGRHYAVPIALLFAGIGLHELFELLGVPPSVLWALGSGSWLAAVFGATWVSFSALNDVGAWLQERSHDPEGMVDGILVSLAISTFKIAIVITGIFVAADILSVPYRTVFAGLGIGGLAFAIAAQDTIANFFGSAVLLADRPFRRERSSR